MAVRATVAGPPAEADSLGSPHLFVIDFERDGAISNISDRQLAIRKRRYARRVRQAATATVWAAGTAAMFVLLFVGIAGLR